MEKKILNYLNDLYEFMEYHNRMAPFPPYDTEYVADVKNKIKEMKENDKIDYDSLPVSACSYCNSLRIEVDEYNNDYCIKCGSVNEITIYSTIHEYLKHKNDNN